METVPEMAEPGVPGDVMAVMDGFALVGAGRFAVVGCADVGLLLFCVAT